MFIPAPSQTKVESANKLTECAGQQNMQLRFGKYAQQLFCEPLWPSVLPQHSFLLRFTEMLTSVFEEA